MTSTLSNHRLSSFILSLSFLVLSISTPRFCNLASGFSKKNQSINMGMFSNEIDRAELKPGDHIYSWRQAYLYAHHGIYIGEGKVIHFTRAAGQEIGTGTILDRVIFSPSPSHPIDNPCPTCGNQARNEGVICSCIDCFLSGDDLSIFEYNVSLASLIAKARGGTCTLASSDPPEQVLHRASFLLENGFGVYNIFKNNCEDFAIYCKTGLLVNTSSSVGRSGQVTSAVAGLSAFFCPLIGLGGLAGVGLAYCASRWVSDIGMRRDAEKVDVESLVAGSGLVGIGLAKQD